MFLAALLTAQAQRLPVAPTRRMSLAILGQLRELGVIDTPWPAIRWEVCIDAEETPLELFQWRLTWTAYHRHDLLIALEDYLQAVPRDDYGLAIRLRLWTDLAVVEAEGFFEQQLTKFRFDAQWANDMAFVYRETRPALSLSQWRYCAWAATRQGASVALRLGSATPAVREAIYHELKRRASRIGAGHWGDCALTPFQIVPQSALGRHFVSSLTQLGLAYWNLPPFLEGLVQASPSHAGIETR